MTTPSNSSTIEQSATAEDIIQRLRETSVTDSPFAVSPTAFEPGVAETLTPLLVDANHALADLYTAAKSVGDLESAVIFVLLPLLAIAAFEDIPVGF